MLGLMLISLSDPFQAKRVQMSEVRLRYGVYVGHSLGTHEHTSGGGVEYNYSAAYHLILVVGLGLVMHVLVQVHAYSYHMDE